MCPTTGRKKYLEYRLQDLVQGVLYISFWSWHRWANGKGKELCIIRASAFLLSKNRKRESQSSCECKNLEKEGSSEGKRGNLWKESSTYYQDCGALWKDFVLLRTERRSTTRGFGFVSMQMTMPGSTFLDISMSSSFHGMVGEKPFNNSYFPKLKVLHMQISGLNSYMPLYIFFMPYYLSECLSHMHAQ